MALRINSNPSAENSLRFLDKAQEGLTKSLERLASGQKINSGVDAPAGLIISERLRGQIAGVEQAISNSEFSISMVQTAEGALTEVNNLLIQSRQLALAAANEGANDADSLQALQQELANALESIDRVSANTSFGKRKLLDGSRGVTGVGNGEGLEFVGASVRTQGSGIEGFEVNIEKVATRAKAVATASSDDIPNLSLTINSGGRSVTVQGKEGEDFGSFASRVQDRLKDIDSDVMAQVDVEAEELTLEAKTYGAQGHFQVTSSLAGFFSDTENETKEINNGEDIAGKINGESAIGVGQVLTGRSGNRTTDGLAVRYTGQEADVVGTVSVSQNALVFQIGPNRNQTVAVAIQDTSTDALSRGVQNDSGFRNLSEVNILTPQAAQDTIMFVDRAIDQLSSIRGELGAFQKNSLESNVATLRVTAENLIAAESSIRDTDVARELAEFTRQQILTQTSAAALAQANSLPKIAINTLTQ